MDDINNHNTVYRFCLKCRLIRCAYVQRRIKVRTCIHRMTHHDDSLVKYHLSIFSNNIEIFEIFKLKLNGGINNTEYHNHCLPLIKVTSDILATDVLLENTFIFLSF